MTIWNEMIYSTEITWQTALFRIILSFLIGAVIGIEREAQNQAAGLRTHILISIGSTIVMLLSIYIPQTFTTFQNGDPGRIAAQVVSGIGFLGAGAILKFGGNIKGLTTAASIWAMAALGMAIGAGMYVISAIAAGVILFALTIMFVFEKFVFKEKSYKKIEIVVKKKGADAQAFKNIMLGMKIHISSSGFERNVNEATHKIRFLTLFDSNLNLQELVDKIEEQEGVISVSVEMID
jgi:putative Mg2+ transporter-C (MgtC) family protein